MAVRESLRAHNLLKYEEEERRGPKIKKRKNTSVVYSLSNTPT
jgi:hypothetical protein